MLLPNVTGMADWFWLLGGMYGNFAGRDASRGMAKQSFDEGIIFGRLCYIF